MAGIHFRKGFTGLVETEKCSEARCPHLSSTDCRSQIITRPKMVEDNAAECHLMGICIIRFILIFVIIFKQT